MWLRFITVLTAPLIILSAVSSLAHKLSVFAWVDGDELVVEAQFRKGTPVVRGMVLVYDENENLILETQTNETGVVRFAIPAFKDGLKIVVRGGEQHQAYWILTAADIEMQQKKPGGTRQ